MRAVPSIAAFAAAALIAGCEAPPHAPAASAFHGAHALRQEPLRAAACIARNVDRYRSPYSAQIVPGTAPAVAEVVIRAAEPAARARLVPAGTASVVEIEKIAEPLYGLDDLLATMTRGC